MYLPSSVLSLGHRSSTVTQTVGGKDGSTSPYQVGSKVKDKGWLGNLPPITTVLPPISVALPYYFPTLSLVHPLTLLSAPLLLP